METAALTKVTRHGQVTLPASVRRSLRLKEGDYVEVRVSGDDIILTPKKLIDASQAYFWTESWQDAEREADEDIAVGRVREYDKADDLIVSLREGRKVKP